MGKVLLACAALIFGTFGTPRATAAEANWVKELRRLGFSGYPIIIRNDEEWEEARLSPTVFIIQELPRIALPSLYFPYLNSEWLRRIREELAAGDVILGLALPLDPYSPRAGVGHVQNQKWKALRRKGETDKQVLIWTSMAKLDTLVHEVQHLRDNRVAIDSHLQSVLSDLDFPNESQKALTTLITELRAYSSQLVHEDANLNLITDGVAYYLDEALDVLASQPYTQSLRYATLVRSYLIDVPQSDLGDYVVKKLEAPPCERSLSADSDNN